MKLCSFHHPLRRFSTPAASRAPSTLRSGKFLHRLGVLPRSVPVHSHPHRRRLLHRPQSYRIPQAPRLSRHVHNRTLCSPSLPPPLSPLRHHRRHPPSHHPRHRWLVGPHLILILWSFSRSRWHHFRRHRVRTGASHSRTGPLEPGNYGREALKRSTRLVRIGRAWTIVAIALTGISLTALLTVLTQGIDTRGMPVWAKVVLGVVIEGLDSVFRVYFGVVSVLMYFVYKAGGLMLLGAREPRCSSGLIRRSIRMTRLWRGRVDDPKDSIEDCGGEGFGYLYPYGG